VICKTGLILISNSYQHFYPYYIIKLKGLFHVCVWRACASAYAHAYLHGCGHWLSMLTVLHGEVVSVLSAVTVTQGELYDRPYPAGLHVGLCPASSTDCVSKGSSKHIPCPKHRPYFVWGSGGWSLSQQAIFSVFRGHCTSPNTPYPLLYYFSK